MAQTLREMVVESVRVHMLSSQHVVILREADAERYLPIWIGSWEAQSIAMKLQGVEAERPLTHDLLATILEELGASVRHIVVSDLADETYRARIVLVQDGSDYEIDARPSDAIALAVRSGSSIFATEAVLDRAGVIPEADEDEKLSVFRDFVNSLDSDPDAHGRGGAQGGTLEGPPRDLLSPADPPADPPADGALDADGGLPDEPPQGEPGNPG
jgi:bifunctional DNase/RNase